MKSTSMPSKTSSPGLKTGGPAPSGNWKAVGNVKESRLNAGGSMKPRGARKATKSKGASY